MEYLLFSLLIGVLSFVSGMLGLGVAFIATPVLGLFGFDLRGPDGIIIALSEQLDHK